MADLLVKLGCLTVGCTRTGECDGQNSVIGSSFQDATKKAPLIERGGLGMVLDPIRLLDHDF